MSDTLVPEISIHLQSWVATGPGDWNAMLDLARIADRAGVDRLVVSDHIAFGENLEAYADPSTGGTAGGKQPTSPDGLWLEPMTVLSVVAGITSRIRLGTAVLLAALRRPAVLAKTAATLDVLSGGRLDLGVGIGWQREEYEVAGLDYGKRGDLLDRCLAVCSTLWNDPVSAYSDDALTFERIHAMPKPLQPGGVPIWVSGRINPKTVARTVRFGAGWIPWGDDLINPGPGIAVLRAAMEQAGRDPALLHVQGTLPVVNIDGEVDVAATMDGVPALVELGVTDFRFRHRTVADPARAEDVLTRAVAAFREVTAR
ncbi:MAG TPA: TIGR03619 family F420-dependent LLM class oxidoreductase [Ilumatobacteraceae bacterium]